MSGVILDEKREQSLFHSIGSPLAIQNHAPRGNHAAIPFVLYALTHAGIILPTTIVSSCTTTILSPPIYWDYSINSPFMHLLFLYMTLGTNILMVYH